MERLERSRLESIKRSLQKSLTTVKELLKIAHAPRRLSHSDVKQRAQTISAAVRAKGGKVTADELRQITTKHGMPFTAVGSLVGGGYLKRTKKGFELGKRGRGVQQTKRTSQDRGKGR